VKKVKGEKVKSALEQVRHARHRISEQFDHDPRRLVEYYMELQQRYKERLVGAKEAETGRRGALSESLKPGDTVVWWKRIPGGEYVFPVKATVLALTPKRVKIEAEDEGQKVIRYVPVQSLQLHQG
jgi:hypothetical protein